MKVAILHAAIFLITSVVASSEPFYYFIPPAQWKVVDPQKLSKSIKIAFIANCHKAFKPSLNLAIEKTTVSLDEYLTAVKKQHTSNRKNRWHEVGLLNTRSGKGHLSQIDTKSECGDIRSMQLIFMQEGYAYIMTAVALRDDFFEYQPKFIKAFESFSISENALSSLTSKALKEDYTEKTQQLLQNFHAFLAANPRSKQSLDNPLFQKNHWKTFEKHLSQTFKDQGIVWHVMAVKEIKTLLTQDKQSH